MRTDPPGNNRTVNNQPLPGQVSPRAESVTQAGANPAAAVARESFGNRVAYWVERASYAAPFVVMALSPASDYLVPAAFAVGGFAASMAQKYQQNVERGSLRSVAALSYMILGVVGVGTVLGQQHQDSISEVPVEKPKSLVERLQECPAGLALWEKAQNEMKGTLTVLLNTEAPAEVGYNQIVIPSDMNQIEAMSHLISSLPPRAFLPEAKDLHDRASRGQLSKRDYHIERSKDLLRGYFYWEEVIDQCARENPKDFPIRDRIDRSPEGYKVALNDFIENPEHQRDFYAAWNAQYKRPFCRRFPHRADCGVAM